MKKLLTSIGLPALLALLLVVPFASMEVVNRRGLNEPFPFTLFFVLWLNLFAIGLILLPFFQAERARKSGAADPGPASGNGFLSRPGNALLVSLGLVAVVALLLLLDRLGWEPLQRLVNDPDPAQAFLPGRLLSLALIALPITAGRIAAGPVVRSLRGGGRLFAHPFHLLLVVGISALLLAGVAGLLIDQWPCFLGIPVCD